MSNPSPRKQNQSLDEEIVKKKSIPAQIAFWIVVVVLLFLTYKALSGLGSH